MSDKSEDLGTEVSGEKGVCEWGVGPGRTMLPEKGYSLPDLEVYMFYLWHLMGGQRFQVPVFLLF